MGASRSTRYLPLALVTCAAAVLPGSGTVDPAAARPVALPAGAPVTPVPTPTVRPSPIPVAAPTPLTAVAPVTPATALTATRAATATEVPRAACPPGAPIRQVRLPTGARKIALTFDDGPWPRDTVSTMDTLARHGLEGKATFFAVGRNVEAHPELARLIVARGYTLANHSVSHRYRPATIAAEAEANSVVLEAATGVRPRYFRAPGLTRGDAIDAAMVATGLCNVSTTITLGDTERPAPDAATLVARLQAQTTPGAIVLMHTEGPRRDAARAALDEFLTWATDPAGGDFEIVSLDELMTSGVATTDSRVPRPPRPPRSRTREPL